MNVFIVEDSEDIRGYLQSMLSGIPGVSVVGFAADEEGAIKRIDELLPDVVTLDLSLQPGSGIAVLENIKKSHPAIKVIVLTNYVDDFYTSSCKDSGADCVFDKTFQFAKVRPAIWSWLNASRTGNAAKP
jgi:DNA-binding NarL/FixJ family response regulator